MIYVKAQQEKFRCPKDDSEYNLRKLLTKTAPPAVSRKNHQGSNFQIAEK